MASVRTRKQPPEDHFGFIMMAVTGTGGMNTLPFYRKRELSPLRRACLSLGLPINAKPETNHAWLLRRLGLGSTGIDYLKFSGDDQAQQIVALYHSLNATERRAVSIDHLVLAAGADVHHVWGLIQEELSRVTDTRAMLMTSMRASDVIETAIESALTPEGHHDRELVMQAARVFPIPGPTTPRLNLLESSLAARTL
jgi:hypothetical protein